ncbi:MAG TPA: hypothetical protein VHK26_02995, partial [Methyloceanibacter sp.]|nr:hypothetical protein [Methyloceanibacter sp.]
MNRRAQRLLLSPPLALAEACCVSVVVDQLELAAAADGGGAEGLGAGVAAGGAAAGAAASASACTEGSVIEPHQRETRLPPRLVLEGFDPSATEVLQAPGEASAVRAPGDEACGGGEALWLTLVLKSGTDSARGLALALDSPAGTTS